MTPSLLKAPASAGNKLVRRAPAALVAAESDNSGAGGLQAALRTFAALGVHPLSVVTRIAARRGVSPDQVLAMPVEAVVTQWQEAWEAVGAEAVLLGSLATPGIAQAVAKLLTAARERSPLLPVVLDPKIYDKSARRVAPEALDSDLKGRLFKHATVLVVSAVEAEALTSRPALAMDGRRDAMKALHDMGAGVVVGLSSQRDRHAVDLAYDGSGFVEFGADRLEDARHEGASDILSAAITAHMARGVEVMASIERAKALVNRSISRSVQVGRQDLACANPLVEVYRQVGLRYDVIEDRSD